MPKPPQFYGQHDEEQVILKYVGDKTDGKYVDVGAGNARMMSNTFWFYEIGWRGLCIEPAKEQATAEGWAEIRPRDVFLGCALSDHDGTIEMITTGCVDSMIGEIYATREYPGRERTVQCWTMNSVLTEYPEFKEVDFMSMDVDSYEHKILPGMDFKVFKPKLIVIEYVVRNTDFRKNWEHLLLPFYEPKESLAGNYFYLRRDTQ